LIGTPSPASSLAAGTQAVIEETGLRTRENVLRLIDLAILSSGRSRTISPPLSNRAGIGFAASFPTRPGQACSIVRCPHHPHYRTLNPASPLRSRDARTTRTMPLRRPITPFVA
jgi:hypothetical protein